jgi:microcystin degradation protein MlrC
VKGAPVFTSYDLHANLTRARVESADALQSYLTNPHRDHVRVGARAARVLLSMLRGRARPTVAWRSLPMVLGGGTTIDFLPTMLPVFVRLRALLRSRGVLAASVNMCHPWNAHPELGWSTAVVTDHDRALAERLADELAEMCWERRHVRPPRFLSPTEAIEQARRSFVRRRLGTMLLVDLSDLVGAGGPGDATGIAAALLAHGDDLRAFVPIRAARAIAELWPRAEGSEITCTVGNPPLVVRGLVDRKVERTRFGRTIVLAVKELSLVLVERPPLVMKPAFYTDVGLDPWRADIVVVKTLFPALAHFAAVNRRTLLVASGGVTDLEAARGLGRDGPVSPFDDVEDWRPADRRRRGQMRSPGESPGAS